MLYLVFGFLEWYESDDSKQPHLAPLVVLPERRGPQGGHTRYGGNPDTCPVRALRTWLEAGAIESGALFPSITRHWRIQTRMSGYAVALIVKLYAGAVGLDMAVYSGHSLRAGLATSAAIAGASERSIMAQTGHKSSAMVRRYIRDASLFRENAAAKCGL